ncbi:hypothetical protein IEO21_09464 [Rhodonia placenta]|uniref:Cytochrome P450 n=1 Tax=Rhodonia placenta TaxID=104341 RepID=A0A8H7NUC4_9APHY|nr:hypothetical protein IEO21_09464 [Postia placenta]
MFALIALALFVAFIAFYRSGYRSNKLPSGPGGLPFVGNIFDLKTHESWRRAVQWGKEHGDMIYIRIFGTRFIFLNSPNAVNDLLHARSSIYSDRPYLQMACGLCGMGDLVPLTRYGGRLRYERRLMQNALGPSAVEKWKRIVMKESYMLLQDLSASPEAYLSHIKRMAASLIFATVYGYTSKSGDDPYVQSAEEFMEVSSHAITAGWIVDFLPFLRWIPYTNFRRTAITWRAKLHDWIERPHMMFKGLPDSAMKRTSFCGNLLMSEGESSAFSDAPLEEHVKWIATSMYGALVLNPKVQLKAQEEIDNAVGKSRLPCFEDRPRLPYVECVLKEVLRWGTPVPLTPPHRLTKRDEYRGYTFPEGTNFIANMWAILHDETMYPDPEKFSPERFEHSLDPLSHKASHDPMDYAFGFGRRRCPGIHFANQSIWFVMVSILACFDVKPAIDENGMEIMPPLIFAGGAFRHPKAFRCRITLRAEVEQDLILTSLTACSA